MVNSLLLTNIAECALPLNVTVEEFRNPPPVIVTTKVLVPELPEFGDRIEMEGWGFGTVTLCTTKLWGSDDAPGVPGFATVTEKVPATLKLPAVNDAVNCCGFTKVVARGVPLRLGEP